jgi:hypothetical protein
MRMSYCPRCTKDKPRSDFHKDKGTDPNADGLQSYCKQCTNEYAKDRRLSQINKLLVWGSRSRAKDKGVEHTITDEDVVVPNYCPALGVKLEAAGPQSDSSPSLDRVDPTKGYVPGNVVVISKLANRIKTNATADQIEKVAKWLRTMK